MQCRNDHRALSAWFTHAIHELSLSLFYVLPRIENEFGAIASWVNVTTLNNSSSSRMQALKVWSLSQQFDGLPYLIVIYEFRMVGLVERENRRRLVCRRWRTVAFVISVNVVPLLRRRSG